MPWIKSGLIVFWIMAGSNAMALDVRLAWDAMPAGQAWTAVRIYERTGPAPYAYNKVAEVTQTTTTAIIANVAAGTHVYVARSYNGQSESPDSNPVTAVILAIPSSPTTVTVTIVVQ